MHSGARPAQPAAQPNPDQIPCNADRTIELSADCTALLRTTLYRTAATIAGGVTAFSIASFASSDETPPASPGGDAYAAAALDLADTSSTPSPAPSGGPAKSGQYAQFQHGEAVVRDKTGKLITVDR